MIESTSHFGEIDSKFAHAAELLKVANQYVAGNLPAKSAQHPVPGLIDAKKQLLGNWADWRLEAARMGVTLPPVPEVHRYSWPAVSNGIIENFG